MPTAIMWYLRIGDLLSADQQRTVTRLPDSVREASGERLIVVRDLR
jgi:hypothetical protein